MSSVRARPAGTYALLVAAVVAFAAGTAAAQEIRGAGSTFVAPVMVKWAEHYAAIGGNKIEYQSVGSGAGIQQIETGVVDFGATDKPLDPSELSRFGLCQFPVVIGAIVPVANLPGVAQGRLRFSGKLLADIFMGKIKEWDDPAIRSVNADLNLPHMPIIVVHRSDGSGTTYNWVDFLAKSSAEWRTKIGVGLTVNWPVGLAGNGNAGVATAVRQATGAIGYVEFAYALKDNLTYGQLQNAYGFWVAPTSDAFEANATTINWQLHQDFSAPMTNAGGPLAYPAVAASFIVMPRVPKDAARGRATLAFFKWVFEHGGQDASELHYVVLPPTLILLIEDYWKAHIVPAARN